jgi:hypothetical protein
MHKAFARNRVRREWFVFHPDMLTHVPDGPAPRPKLVAADLVSWAKDICPHRWPCNCNSNSNPITDAQLDELLWRTRPAAAIGKDA